MTIGTSTSVGTGAAQPPVRCSVLVAAPIERAFRVFTLEMPSWWHPDHHLLAGELAEMVFEPRVGGSILDRGTDGSECRWATIVAYEPPDLVAFSWNIDPAWELETDPERTSRVEVRFVAEDAGHTRVTLDHLDFERLGPGGGGMREAVSAPGGWPDLLRRFVDHVGGPDGGGRPSGDSAGR